MNSGDDGIAAGRPKKAGARAVIELAFPRDERVAVSVSPESKPAGLWESWRLRIFGPRTATELAVEELRLSHGMRKFVMLLAVVLFFASTFSCIWFAVLENGYPQGWMSNNPYAWFAYYGRIGASVLVMLLTLNGMFRLAVKEKQLDILQAAMEPTKDVKNMLSKTVTADNSPS